MAFKFIHTADWQIGKRFGRFPAEKATLLNQARMDAIQRIATEAQAHGARHVLIAGDIFDSETLPDELGQRTLTRLSMHTRVVWHLLPGNHDPARPGGLWGALTRNLPGNVHLHLEPRTVDLEPGVVLLTAPLAAKSTTVDPTAWMDATPSPAGTIRIGLAHGSVQGFGSLGEAAVPIDPARARSAHLDYLALGDWHGTKQIGPATWYAGTPEPDSFTDNGPGNILVVDIPGVGSQPTVTPVSTATYRWLARRVLMTRLEDIEPLIAELDRLGPATSHHVLDLSVEGRLPVAARAMLEQNLSRLALRLFHVRTDYARLRWAAGVADLEALPAGALRTVAERLTKAAEEDGPDARVAADALSRLFAFDAALGAEGTP